MLQSLKFKSYLCALLLLATAAGETATAQEPGALEIVENVYNRDEGESRIGKIRMTLINHRNDQRIREIRQYVRDYGDMDKIIMFFITPADVRNTSFLSWAYDDESKVDNQWIYLPALKKVKRISSDSKKDYFMGSDFTYDDMGDRHPNADNHQLLRTETLNGEECYVIESIPKEKGYMYSKKVTWVIKDKWIELKKTFYDEDGELLKNLSSLEYSLIKGYWFVTHLEMHNVQKNHRTDMEFIELELDAGVDDNYFTERMMSQGI